MQNGKRIASALFSLLLVVLVSNCSRSSSGAVENVVPTTSDILAPTTLPDWKQKQLDEEQEKSERISYWQQNNAMFREAIKLSEPEGGLDEVIYTLASDLAEANGLLSQFKTSEYEVVRSVASNYMSEIAAAIEELLDSFASSDQARGAKALAQIEYLDRQQGKITLCVIQNDFNC